ncbi:hypothetical protein QYE76_035887 [Lolium multiflorum]|uniref:F-box domain-containing protein n=1 Tax=Lolium multiflorum TaxID=4521 RepID=A0AAD8VML5_LOLMU|nr:hypothetical protein QYE76_035887 [Lolium multiflorum]
MVEEILMRVPAMSLCRLREVCRLWRSIVSDPSFIKAHAALHPALLLTLDGAGNHIGVVDLSGNVIKRINVPAAVEEGNRVRVVDPDTCAVSALPVEDLDPPAGQWTGHWPQPSYTPWRDFSTGNRKVLRIATLNSPGRPRFEQLRHVLNLDGGNPRRGGQRQSPRSASRPTLVSLESSSNISSPSCRIESSPTSSKTAVRAMPERPTC